MLTPTMLQQHTEIPDENWSVGFMFKVYGLGGEVKVVLAAVKPFKHQEKILHARMYA